MVKAQAAPLYWIFFMTLIFGIILLVTFLSPLIESISSITINMSSALPLNGSVNTTVTRWNLTYNLAPLILIVGLLFAIIVVSQRREFDTGEAGYG